MRKGNESVREEIELLKKEDEKEVGERKIVTSS
jgi:hypothetical protein